MKKITKYLLLSLFIIVSIHFLLSFYIGGINYKETLKTKYHLLDNKQIIETSHFKIETPKNWIHIFNGYGEEADASGVFITRNGLVSYEYGMFSNSFRIDSIFFFSRDSLIANRFHIYLGYNKTKTEAGIYIPLQHEMEWSFSFFMSKACFKNKDELIKGIQKMEFKKFYNINWEIDDNISF